MNRSKHVFFDDLFAEQNRVFVVIAFPRHERNQNVSAQCQFATICRGTVSQHLAFFNNFALVNKRTLINAGSLVRAQIFKQFIFVNTGVFAFAPHNNFSGSCTFYYAS